MPDISDRDSAAWHLTQVRRRVDGIDLDHPHRAYQAAKADQLARQAAALAHDLGLLARSERIRVHLVLDHGHQEPDRDALDCAEWYALHQAAHHPGTPTRRTHAHHPDDSLLNPVSHDRR